MSDKLKIDVKELFDGWDTNKYTCTYVLGQIRQLEGNGPLSERIKDALNRTGSSYNGQSHAGTNGSGGMSNAEILDLIRLGSEMHKKALANEITLDKYAELITAHGWDGSDPTNRIERLEPHNVKDILNERKINGEYLEELTPHLQFLFKSLIHNAWKAWIRKHGNESRRQQSEGEPF